jgi:hypothetical protein
MDVSNYPPSLVGSLIDCWLITRVVSARVLERYWATLRSENITLKSMLMTRSSQFHESDIQLIRYSACRLQTLWYRTNER